VAAYVALRWTGATPDAVMALRAAAPSDWRIAWEAPDSLVLVRDPSGAPVRRLPGDRGLVLGDLYRASFQGAVGEEVESLVISRAAPVEAIAADLLTRFWGRYVALITEPGGAWSILRDPGGGLEAMTWSREETQIVASHLPTWLAPELWPLDLAIDWRAVAAWVRSSAAIGAQAALSGLEAVTPGALLRSDGGVRQVWSPAGAARAATPRDAHTALRDTVDACVRRLVGDAPVLAEISGGLDSAILAASLAGQVRDQVLEWTNYYVPGRRGDERAYARDVARHLDIPLTEVLKPDFAVTEMMLALCADGLRPGFSAKDAARDADAADRARTLGAGRIVTGQGGDMAFFATPTPLLLIDALRDRGPAVWTSDYALNVARWCRRSIWTTPGLDWKLDLARQLRPVAGHPWAEGIEDLPPAKQVQIATLAHKLTIQIEGLRGRAAEVVHPLLAQPVMELCLSLPTSRLTAGGRDRGLARQAFAGRLPDSVRLRQSKGELGAYYGQVAAASLPMLRDYLLDGELVRAGLLDRARLEPMLVRDHLIWRGDYSALMSFAVVEAWVRHWADRLAAAGASGRVASSQASTRAR
jgi:asparagine synthase (glutamine-hydrolysing)